jgi:hypothetical protein
MYDARYCLTPVYLRAANRPKLCTAMHGSGRNLTAILPCNLDKSVVDIYLLSSFEPYIHAHPSSSHRSGRPSHITHIIQQGIYFHSRIIFSRFHHICIRIRTPERSQEPPPVQH